MNDTSPTTWQVTVGLTRMKIVAADKAAAVEIARRRLCAEMPRMWDVISRLDESRFVIEQVDDETGRNVA